MKGTLSHEYGHAVADAIVPDENGFIEEASVTAHEGTKLYDHIMCLESAVTGAGLKKKNSVFTRFDPFVDENMYKSERNREDKYAGKDSSEYYAETFKAYTHHPEAFRNKIIEMETSLKSLKPDTKEYVYVQTSLFALKESYNYFKREVFDGYEFKSVSEQ